MYAFLGAMLAAIMTLIESREKKRKLGQMMSAFLSSAAVGALLPGTLTDTAVLMGWMSSATAMAINWKSWALAGLICGLNAWWMIHAFNRSLKRRGQKFLDSDTDNPMP